MKTVFATVLVLLGGCCVTALGNSPGIGGADSARTVVPLLASAGSHEEQREPGGGQALQLLPSGFLAPDLWHRSSLTGSWNGVRDDWRDGGVRFDLRYTADNIMNLGGGVTSGSSYLHSVEASAEIDAAKLLDLTGMSFDVRVLHHTGPELAGSVGAVQSPSGIAGRKTTRLYEALIRQRFMRDRVLVAVGLYDIATEFSVIDAGRIFLNRSFEVGKELSQTAGGGLALFPNSAPAIRVWLKPGRAWSFQFAGAEARPQTYDDGSSATSSLDASRGAFVIGEVTYSWFDNSAHSTGGGKYTLGAWLYTASFEEVYPSVQNPSLRSTANNGVYMIAEQNILSHRETAGGLSLFARVGWANSRINRFDRNIVFGAFYTGLLPGREHDALGVAVAHVSNGTEFLERMSQARLPYANAEIAIEFTYKMKVAPWLTIQPDLQRIIHPGARSDIGNATVFGTRLQCVL